MMIFLIHAILAVVLLDKVSLFRQSGLKTRFWILLLGIKVWVGYAIIAYYDARYGSSDMRSYMDGANTLHRIFTHDPLEWLRVFLGFGCSSETLTVLREQVPFWFGRPYSEWFNDSRTVIRIQALIRLFSTGDLWIHLLWTNVAALVGGVALIRFFFPSTFRACIPYPVIGLLFIPNGLLWSSTILKEPFLLIALGSSLYSWRKWLDTPSVMHGLLLLISCLFFLTIKPFWLLALLPGLIAWTVFRRSSSAPVAVLGSYGVALLLAILAGLFFADVHLPSLLFGEQGNMWRFSIYGRAGSLIDPVVFAPNWISVFKHTPEALFVALSQPVPSGWNDWAGWFLFSENILFVGLLLAVLLRREALAQLRLHPSLLLAVCAGLIVVLVTGFTTPVAGTLIRYRWPGMLLLLMALVTAWVNSSASSHAGSVKTGQD